MLQISKRVIADEVKSRDVLLYIKKRAISAELNRCILPQIRKSAIVAEEEFCHK